MNIRLIYSRLDTEYVEGSGMMVSFPEASRREMIGEDLMKAIEVGDPMNLKVHSGGMRLVICAKSAGRCGRGRVSTRKATLVRSYGEGGGEHSEGGGGSAEAAGVGEGGIALVNWIVWGNCEGWRANKEL